MKALPFDVQICTFSLNSVCYVSSPGERYEDIMSLKDELLVEMRIIESETDKLEVTERIINHG